MTMRLRSVMVQLREDQIAQLDAEAVRSGCSRAQIIRDAVDLSLPVPFDQALADQYQAAYPEASSGTDAWGSLDLWHRSAALSRSHDSHRAENEWA
jgi:hypothetical protein